MCASVSECCSAFLLWLGKSGWRGEEAFGVRYYCSGKKITRYVALWKPEELYFEVSRG